MYFYLPLSAHICECVDIWQTRQVSSMIHSARPIVTPAANIVFCCFVLGTDVRKDGQHMCQHNYPYSCDFGLAEWINITLHLSKSFLITAELIGLLYWSMNCRNIFISFPFSENSKVSKLLIRENALKKRSILLRNFWVFLFLFFYSCSSRSWSTSGNFLGV